MNWEKIEKEHPKAVELLYKYMDQDMADFNKGDIGYVMNDVSFSYSDLFDFFDDNKVFITINADYPVYLEGKIPPINLDEVYWWINIDWIYEDNIEYKTRKEAEEAAFTKAFEILNDKLCKQ